LKAPISLQYSTWLPPPGGPSELRLTPGGFPSRAS
jgi:hypothetical protein